jgi:hypothetical protein
VAALRQIWVQQYYRVIDERGEKVIRREASEHGLPPGRSALISPYDLDARYGEKRGRGWKGCKVHFSETCHQPRPDGARPAPNLITNAATTPAATADVAMTRPIQWPMFLWASCTGIATPMGPGRHRTAVPARRRCR